MLLPTTIMIRKNNCIGEKNPQTEECCQAMLVGDWGIYQLHASQSLSVYQEN